MSEPLIVDTLRLEAAGITLRGQVFPQPPPPIAATGTDAASAAINATTPVIESPVIEGLPVAKAALQRTASSIAAAAGMYADTDQSLGKNLARQEFNAARSQVPSRATGTTADQQALAASADDSPEDQPADGAAPDRPGQFREISSTVMEMTPQINQMVGTVSSLAQSITQSAQGAEQNQPPNNKLDDQPDDETEHVETDEEQQADERAEGAAPGEQTLQSVPTGGIDASDAHPQTGSGRVGQSVVE